MGPRDEDRCGPSDEVTPYLTSEAICYRLSSQAPAPAGKPAAHVSCSVLSGHVLLEGKHDFWHLGIK